MTGSSAAVVRWVSSASGASPDRVEDSIRTDVGGAGVGVGVEGVVLRRARPSDVPALEAFVEPFVDDGTLLRRTADELYRHVREFMVACDAGESAIVGCVALRVHDAALGEVCAVAVSETSRGRGFGRLLVEAAVEDAAALGLRRVFALTRRSEFFRALGFGRVPSEALVSTIGGEQARRVSGSPVVKVAMLRELQRCDNGEVE